MVTTLHVRVEPAEGFDERVAEKLQSVESGDVGELDGEPVLSVPDERTLATVFDGKNLELVGTIATEQPGSIRELARLVDRDVKNVSGAANRLAEIGVVDLVPDGRAKRPVVPYDELEITYRLREAGTDSEAPA